MEGMILAAGLGTRLRPLTDRMPKALVQVGGLPLLEHVARRLVEAGVERLVVNLHPFAARIRRYVLERGGLSAQVAFSEEAERPLETGGGLRHARTLLHADAPFFLHNVDVLTDLPLDALYAAHLETRPLATVAVMERSSARGLYFDDAGLLGRVDEAKGIELRVREAEGDVHRLAFAGIHVIAPALPPLIEEEGAFSILEPYLRLAREGRRILPFRADGCRWVDVGTPERRLLAERLFGGAP